MTAVASWREAMDDRNFLGGEEDAVALIEAASGAKVTYGELAERVEKAAVKLQRDAEGDVAFVFASNESSRWTSRPAATSPACASSTWAAGPSFRD